MAITWISWGVAPGFINIAPKGLGSSYTANGLELDFYVLRNFIYEIQPRQGFKLKRSNERSEIIALRKPGDREEKNTPTPIGVELSFRSERYNIKSNLRNVGWGK
jgi:hypothetical protein